VLRLRGRRDEGSVVLALLAMMMVSSLVFVILATVVHGEKQNRFDRNFEQALLLAEAGHSQIQSFIQSNGASSPAEVASFAQPEFTAVGSGGSNGAGVEWTPLLTRVTAEGTYSVRATRTTLAQGRQTYYTWNIEAEGVAADGRTRNIESEMRVRSVFGLAAFGKIVMNMAGDNFADSFYSTEPITPLGVPGRTEVCLLGGSSSSSWANMGTPTNARSSVEANMCDLADRGQGTVGTNGRLDLQGNTVASVNRMEIYNARERVVDPLPDATGYCQGPPNACENLLTTVPQTLYYYREPIELPPINGCTFPAASVPTSSNGGGAFGASSYDIQDITLDGNTVFTGTSAIPTVLCVRGNFRVANQQLVNFVNAGTAAAPRWVPRRPGTLFIFLTGGANSEVSIGGQAALSAALYAPNNDIRCDAQGNMFGSMVGNTISCQGGFRFHYDQTLGDNLTFPAVRAQNWREIYG